MPLSEPRIGESFGFGLYPNSGDEYTLGDPERVIWTSIKHLCASDVADRILYHHHNISNKRNREYISWNIKLYLQQADEF